MSSQRISEITADESELVLAPKVKGAWLLHEMSQGMALDYFVLFSSAAAIWGSQGAAAYAAANHYLDKLAHYRAGLGLPGLSVNWGWWSGDGIVTGEMSQLFTEAGLRQMPGQASLEALSYLIESGAVQCTVADVDWSTFKPLYEARRSRPLLARIEIPSSNLKVDAEGTPGGLLEELAGAGKSRRKELLLEHVRQQVSEILGAGPDDPLDIRQGFFKLGMDSLMTVQLHSRLEANLGLELPKTLAFEYPSIAVLAGFLAEEVELALDLGQNGAHQDRPLPGGDKDESPPDSVLDAATGEDLIGLLDGELSKINQILEGH